MSAHGQAGLVAVVAGLATIGTDTLAQAAWIVAVAAVVATLILLSHRVPDRTERRF